MSVKKQAVKAKRPRIKKTEVQKQIDADKKLINHLLQELDTDNVRKLLADSENDQEVHTLRQYHNSVGIAFAQLLVYSLKIPRAGMPKDIKFLLDTFRDLAERFYTQYERSLLQDIKQQWDEQDRCQVALDAIKGLSPKDTAVARERLDIHAKEAKDRYESLIKSFPSLLQVALDKLRDEALRVSTIASSSLTLKDNRDLIQTLELVVETTAHFVGVEAERIVVVPGKEFSLNFFRYVDNLAVLSVPIYSVQAPWEWSIFWHELAGYKVRRLETDPTHKSLRSQLETLREKYCELPDTDKETFLYVLAPKSPFGRGYLKTFFSDDPDLDDLGSFDQQFEQILRVLPRNNKLQEYQDAIKAGWCVDWIKELFEDAWSVLSIDRAFLVFFKDILKRHTAKDGRHPPLQVRMDVAGKLLELRDTDYKARSSMPITEGAARQLLKFMTLLRAGEYKGPLPDGKPFEYVPDPHAGTFEMMKTAMQSAIEYWQDKLFQTEDPAQEMMEGVKEFTREVSMTFKDEMTRIKKSHKLAKHQIHSNINALLNHTTYKELQAVAFYDVDFGFPANVITNIIFGKSIREATQKSFTAIANFIKINLLGSCLIPGPGGDNDVTYTGPDSKTYHAALVHWNDAFSRTEYELP